MVSSPDDRVEEQTADSKTVATPVKPKADWTAQLDTQQVFRLVDSILPFEACLYHQVLPLSLEGSRLKLGMVNLDDSAALDYVRRILAYMNCSLVPQALAMDAHHAALSAYLSYTGSHKQPTNSPKAAVRGIAQRIEQRLAQETAKNSSLEGSSAVSRNENQPGGDQNSNPTFLVDSPEDLNFQDLDVKIPQAPPVVVSPHPTVSDAVDAPSIAPTTTPARPPAYGAPPQETLILPADSVVADAAPIAHQPEIPSTSNALPILTVEPKHLSEPVEVLAALPPPALLVELLGRLLIGGIGRLYFERQPQQGRILWSQNGVLQSALEALPLATIQSVINELKLLAQLPLIPVQKPKQVEIERLYQKHRLLLRIRVMPGKHGEEATVQVLRGAALRFYQQQQLASLSRDALTTAQELQRKVSEIRSYARLYPLMSPDQLNVLPALTNVLKTVEQQLETLKAMQAIELNKEE